MPHSPSPADTEAVEITELVEYLSETPPFDGLSRDLLAETARHLEISYVQRGTTVFDVGDATDAVYLIRSGAVDLHDSDDALVARLGERDYFGYPALLTESAARRRVTAIEDSLFYQIPEPAFDRLRAASDSFDRFFARAHADRIRDALQESRGDDPLRVRLHTLVSRDPVVAPPSVSIQEAARRMRDAREIGRAHV